MKIEINDQNDLDTYHSAQETKSIISLLCSLCEQYQDHDEVEIIIANYLIPKGYLSNPSTIAQQTKSRIAFPSVVVRRHGSDHLQFVASIHKQSATFLGTVIHQLLDSETPTIKISLDSVPKTYRCFPSQLKTKIDMATGFNTKITVFEDTNTMKIKK